MAINKILKFSTEFCGPCRLLKSELSNFDMPITEIDASEDLETCDKYNVRNVPTLVFLDENDNEIHRHVGFIKKNDLENLINNLNKNEVN